MNERVGSSRSTRQHRIKIGMVVLSLAAGLGMAAEDDPFKKRAEPPIVGRWDLTVRGPEGEFPSWLEVRQLGYRTLVGSYVGRFGSARPISRIDFDARGNVSFAVPPQWEKRTDDQKFEGKLEGETLRGETTDEKGKRLQWEARRAPTLAKARTHEPHWSEPVALFNGRDLSGWKPRNPSGKNGWVVRDEILVNATPGNDLVTERKFSDFKLHAEFRYPKGSNSGIYLRGRYEVQIEDNAGDEPESHKIGGVYGFLTPLINAGKPAGEWQTLDVTLVGRTVSIVLNGQPVIEHQNIPGITGGALDSDEAAPGPIMIQGDHGPVEFRKLVLTPAE